VERCSTHWYMMMFLARHYCLNFISGVPHKLTEDDVYKGYRLPKGSIVVANAW